MENSSVSPSLPPSATFWSVKRIPVAKTIGAALLAVIILLLAAAIGFIAVLAATGALMDPSHIRRALTQITIAQGLTVQLVAYVAIVPYLFFVMTKLWKVTLAELGFTRPTLGQIGIALAGALGMIVVVQGTAQIVQALLHTHHEQQAVQLLRAVRSPGVLVFFTIFAIFIAPFVEELTFRVFIFGGAKRVGPFWLSALLSGVLFGAAHGDWVAFVPLAVGGALLCWVYYTTRNAWTSMISHGLFNGTTVVVLLLAQRAGLH
ncbi:MAG: hypothetical protein NVS9B12_02910 [Vulcanimicrobiaceae bacterium]